MEILITNDDGWGAKGILTIVRIMSELGHVTVVAPNGARSGMSNAITVTQPIYLHKLNDPNWGVEEWQKKVTVYTTNGTPSDCVKLAIDVVFEGDSNKIDLLVSGINHGSNAGINVIYSGTMGACFVGAEHGIPSIGYSIDDHSPKADFSYMEKYILELTKHLLEEKMPYGVCYNVNAPTGELVGVRWTRQCRGYWSKEMIPTIDKEGKACFKLGGEFVNIEPEAQDTDHWAMNNHYLSVQPCTIDQTAYEEI
jgi:5'-nucleotidase